MALSGQTKEWDFVFAGFPLVTASTGLIIWEDGGPPGLGHGNGRSFVGSSEFLQAWSERLGEWGRAKSEIRATARN